MTSPDPMPLGPLPARFAATRDALHRVAAHVLAPARKAANGRIGLRSAPGGFGTPPFGAGEQLQVEGAALIRRRDGAEEKTELTTLGAAADFAGITLAADPGIGHDPPSLGEADAPLAVAAPAAGALGAWFTFSDAVLETFRTELDAAGRACSEVQLWPEHFDLGCSIEGVNFGASPGDRAVPEPYLYVGPWNTDGLPDGGFWNAPFGAVLRYADLLGAADQPAAALEFLRSGAELAERRK